jgi:hypothetical protein
MNPTNVSRVGLGFATVGVVDLVFRESLLAAGAVAIAVQVAAALLMLWARLSFVRRGFHATVDATEGGLVTVGLAARMLAEERRMVERFPEYIQYAAHTKRVILFIL